VPTSQGSVTWIGNDLRARRTTRSVMSRHYCGSINSFLQLFGS
jgi:hypothetical protein